MRLSYHNARGAGMLGYLLSVGAILAAGCEKPLATASSGWTVSAVTVAPASASLAVGSHIQLTDTVKDANGASHTGVPVTWSSSKPAVASVDNTGLVAGLSAGSATIAAAYQGVQGTASVTVAQSVGPPASVTLAPPAANLAVGGQVQFSAIVKDASGTVISCSTLTWSSSAAALASVSNTGLVSGVAAGSATITATCQTVSGNAPVTVATPTPSTEPVYNPATDVLIQQDDFERYANINSMPTYPLPNVSWKIDVVNKALLTGGQGHNGSNQAIRITYPQTAGQVSVTWETHPGSNRYSPATRPVVMQFWFRVTPAGTGGNGNPATKWFEAWQSAAGSRWQISLYIADAPAPYTQSSRFTWQGYAITPAGRGRQPVGPYWQQLNDGQWHRWTVQWKPNTTYAYPSPSSRDGYVRAWIDGSKILDIEQALVNVTPPGGQNPWCIQDDVDALVSGPVDYLAWPNVEVNGGTPTWSVDYDDLMWWAQP